MRFVWPKYIDWKAEADTKRKGTLASLAMALATKVLPVPGGPSKSTPRRADPPMASWNV